jgi:hypothetical protein
MPDGERRKPIDNDVCRTKVKVTTSKNRTNMLYFSRFHMISKEKMSYLSETCYTHA